MGKIENIIKSVVVIWGIFACTSAGTVVQLDPQQFDDFKNGNGVNLVYFQGNFKQKDEQVVQRRFLEQYENAAHIMEVYKVKFGKVTCPDDDSFEFCSEDSAKKVFVFRNGHTLLSLNLDNMFDVDSIVSNVLQVILLKTVPIIQSSEEREKFFDQYRQHYNFFYSYYPAIGSHGYRAFMEVAFAYQSRYKFAVTTLEEAAQGLRDFMSETEEAVWFVRCVDLPANEPCIAYKYRDDLELSAMFRFVEAVGMPNIHQVTDDCSNPFESLNIHTVALYQDKNTEAEMKALAIRLTERFTGLVGVVLVNFESTCAESYGLVRGHTKVTGVSFQYRGNSIFNMKPQNVEAEVFVNNYLTKVIKTLPRIQTGETPIYQDAIHEEVHSEAGEDENQEYLVEVEDCPVAKAAYERRKQKLDRSLVPALNDKTFYTETQNADFLFVLFYLKFDPRSVNTLKHFVDASVTLSDSIFSSAFPRPLAAVNCFDWTDVCARANVTSWPTLRVYRKGKPTRTYRGMLSPDSFVRTVNLYLIETPVHLSTHAQFESLTEEGHVDNKAVVSNVSFIGLFTSADGPEYAAFMELAALYEGEFMFAFATETLAAQLAEFGDATAPALLVARRHDAITPFEQYTGEWMLEAQVEFVRRKHLASFPELNVYSMPALMALQQPLLILFVESPDSPAYQATSELVKQKSFQQLVICWMDLNEGLSHRLLLEYNPAAPTPAVFLVKHTSGRIFYHDDTAITSSGLTTWINAVMEGKEQPSKLLVEKVWAPRVPAYDFLTKIDREKSSDESGMEEVEDEIELDKEDESVTRGKLRGLHADMPHPQPEVNKKHVVHKHAHTEL